jgi:cation transport regulator ChaC
LTADTARHYVFGYGSLLELRDRHADRSTPCTAVLIGYRRLWNVAMDNTVDLPGYKHYIDPVTRTRPDVFVTFLNIEPTPGTRVNGSLIEVSSDELAALDARERNYARIDVSAALAAGVDGTVWSYSGTTGGIDRFALGMRTGRAVIQRDYHDLVRRQFAALGPDGLRDFERLTGSPPCPIVDLRRVEG